MKNSCQLVRDDVLGRRAGIRRLARKTIVISPIVLLSVLILALFAAIATNANATLIMGKYNNGALYVASDSCMTRQIGQDIQQFKILKLFKVSDYCCVSICNNYGGYMTNPQGTNLILCLFPNELARLCSQIISNTNDQASISAINAKFAMIYANYWAKRTSFTGDSETRLTYWGYDRSTHRFFVESYLYDGSTGTNIPVNVVAFDRGAEKTGSPLTLTAEVGFLSALIVPVLQHTSGQPGDNLAPLRTQAFRDEVEHVFQETPMDVGVNLFL